MDGPRDRRPEDRRLPQRRDDQRRLDGQQRRLDDRQERGDVQLPRRGETTLPERGDALPARRQRQDPTAPIQRKQPKPLPDFTGMQPVAGQAETSFHDFLPDAQRIVVTPPTRFSRGVAYAVCGCIVAGVAWAIFGHLSLFAIAPGQFQPRGGSQVVESREAGQVSKIAVQEGNHVKKGDLVLQLDPTAAQAAKTIIEAKLANARAQSVRASAAVFVARSPEIDKKAPIAWPAGLPADVTAREESVFRADLAQLAATLADLQAKLVAETAMREKYVANIAAQKVLIDSRTQRTAMHEKLATQGWDSRATVLQSMEPLREDQVSLATYEGSLEESKATIKVINDELAQARASFIADNTNAGATADRQVEDLAQQLKKATLLLANLSLRAPTSGSVQALSVTSLGQAVKVGEQLMQVVPDDVPLEIQAYVLNSDIGFVKNGQLVTIKVDTFPFTRYGTIQGKVTHVGADAITGAMAAAQQKNDTLTPKNGSLSVTNATQQMKDLVFPVTIVPEKTTIEVEGRAVPLTSGMSLVAEIETENQRAIGYILYPLTRVFRRGPPEAADTTAGDKTADKKS